MTVLPCATQCLVLISLFLAPCMAPPGDWSRDTAWHEGKAEWALYQAQRVIYGEARAYEATIFTNTQLMNPKTTTKSDQESPGVIEVFKLNISEQIPTENYDYRFLTTSFVQRDDLSLYKLTTSTQEDCGSTYRHFLREGTGINFNQYNYFPGPGHVTGELKHAPDLAFFNALPLTLRNFPFPADRSDRPTVDINLVADQTKTRRSDNQPHRARITYLGREQLTVPIGTIATHHLTVQRIGHPKEQAYHFWMADEARHVMVKFTSPDGTEYQLKRLAWWAYWKDPVPPTSDDLLGRR